MEPIDPADLPHLPDDYEAPINPDMERRRMMQEDLQEARKVLRRAYTKAIAYEIAKAGGYNRAQRDAVVTNLMYAADGLDHAVSAVQAGDVDTSQILAWDTTGEARRAAILLHEAIDREIAFAKEQADMERGRHDAEQEERLAARVAALVAHELRTRHDG